MLLLFQQDLRAVHVRFTHESPPRPVYTSACVTVNYIYEDRNCNSAQDAGQVGPDQAFSTKLTSDQAIVVERAMYWPNGSGSVGGHDTSGATQSSTTWYLAEGYTGDGFETYILIQNPNAATANVTVTYMLPGGGTLTRNVLVTGNSRYTIEAQNAGQVGPDQAFSTKLTSDQPIFVERAMYFYNGGHATAGVYPP